MGKGSVPIWVERGTSIGVVPEYVASEVDSVLIDEATIAKRVEVLGEEIARDYADKNPVLLGVLTGSFIFLADLSRQTKCRHQVCFARASSYVGQESSGHVTVSGLEGIDLSGRHLVIVEDIVDTGLTLTKLLEFLKEKGAASLAVCSFLVKKTERRSANAVALQYAAFEIPDAFVVGYGLDYDQALRHLPFVGICKPA